ITSGRSSDWRTEAFFKRTVRGATLRFRRVPVDRSSIVVTSLRLPSQSTRWDPMKPAPPVMRIRFHFIGSKLRGRATYCLRMAYCFLRLLGPQARELHADVVEATGGVRILGLAGGRLHAAVREVLSRQGGHGRRRHEEHGGLRALRGALEEHADEPEQRRRLASKVRLDDAGVAGVDRHAGAREAAREFGREEDLRELRLAVRARAPILRLPL